MNIFIGKGKKALALANNDIVQDKSEREGEIELNNVAVKDESDKIEHIESEYNIINLCNTITAVLM